MIDILLGDVKMQLWEEEGTICFGVYKEGYDKDEILNKAWFKDICDRVKVFFDKDTDELVGVVIVGFDVILDALLSSGESPDERERTRVEILKEKIKKLTEYRLANERKRNWKQKMRKMIDTFGRYDRNNYIPINVRSIEELEEILTWLEENTEIQWFSGAEPTYFLNHRVKKYCKTLFIEEGATGRLFLSWEAKSHANPVLWDDFVKKWKDVVDD